MVKILLLGEGDFSFTRALCTLLKGDSKEMVAKWLGRPISDLDKPYLISTSLDTRLEVIERYHSPNLHLDDPSFVEVHHGVNALDHEQLRSLVGESSQPDFVVWNHPHLGIEDCMQHHELLCHFFHSISQVVPNAVVIVSLLSEQITRWRVLEAAEKLSMKLVRIEPLVEEQFPSYMCKRTLSGDSFKSARSRSNWGTDKGSLDSIFLYFESRNSESEAITDPLERIREIISESQSAIPVSSSHACKECEKSFSTEQGLRTHVRQVHQLALYSAAAPVACATCGKSFSSQDKLRMHELNAHGQLDVKQSNKRQRTDTGLDSSYSCAICGSVDVDHVKKFGSTNKAVAETFPCGSCDKVFKSQRALNQHTNVVHPVPS